MNANTSSIASTAQQAVSAAAAAASRQTDAVTLTSGTNSSADAGANVGANGTGVGVGVPGGAGGDWRDKDADRSARQQIARIIANRPASVNYNPREIARRLEHTLYMSASSRDEYSNVQTLKARLQQALDNSRRRQMQQQQQQQSTPTSQATDLQQQAQAQAQQLQQQQLQLLQRQQQQMAAHLQSQRNSFQGVPFAAAPVQIPQQPATSQQLQMPLSVSMQVNNPSAVSMATTMTAPSTSTTNVGAPSSGSSILDELEREADEMANGVSDEPIAMPESELQDTATVATSIAGGNNFGGAPTSVASTVAGAQFNPVALSMPPEISAGLSSPSVSASAGFGLQPNPAMVAAVPSAVGGSNLYHGMNLTGPQIQQLQQLQQMQQLRRMQQMQLQQQHVANVASMGMNPTATGNQLQRGVPTAAPVTSASPVTPTAGTPTGMGQMTEASIAQKREELKRRLIQLKHARTCTTGECTIEYCSRTKALLAHVSRCANAQCTTIGCKSTRQLLSHFRKCRNLQCDVCSAIRPPMNETEQQLVLRRQQERLCMLRHASTCATPQCILPYCAGMKVLWKHICECHQRQCRTDHCISSRYVLSHFKQCNKMICEVCGPVRKAIKIVDSCRGNPAQLQMAASQCPEGVRGLIKIMNTTVSAGAAGNSLTNNGAGAAGVSGTGHSPSAQAAAALQQRQAAMQQSGGAAWTAGSQPGVVKTESKVNVASSNPAVASTNASMLGANMPSGSVDAAKLPNGNAVAQSSAGVDIESKTGAVADLNELKKKPLKFQTEKEKKLRRKEQAKIAKARAQAKAQAASNGTVVPGTPVSEKPAAPAKAAPVLPNGLVVRGSQASLRSDQHVSHQDISYLDSMTERQLDEHIRSLRFNFCGHITLTELKNRLMPLITKLMESEYGWTFNNPVDPVQWNIPDYFDIIKCPMDLGTIKKRLENEHYNSVEAFAGDVRLVFENCIAYNSSTNKFNQAAKQLLASFDKSLAALKNQLEKQLFKRCEQRREEMCQLCGGDSFKFAPCMLFCSGPCAGRIRRHTHYYSDPRGEHHWCSSCYKQMKDGPIDMSTLPQLTAATPADGAPSAGPTAIVPFDGVLKKSSLLKRKNSEVAEEPWVECDSCKLWYHQICALFNERNHAISGEQEPFVCPICVKKQRVSGVKPSTENGLKASRLPITRMARLIERRVLEAIEQAGKDEAERMGNLGNSDSIGFSRGVDEPVSETHFGVTIREVLSIDKQVQIKPKMGKLLAAHYGKPKKSEAKGASGANAGGTGQTKSLKRQRTSSTDSATKKRSGNAAGSTASAQSLQLTYRSRCICVFQELDGVDVLIFTLYVQEYGPDSLEPNAGRVYVSYLDSVNYFQPKKLRTLMHQQVMLGFLEDCKNRGFHTAHIWSCPPLKGDDYIFFCKPENQKIPKSARLRQWYQKLLQQAKKDGLVCNISNLYAEYYMKKKAAHELPYFEGDYWPRLAEDLIKQIEEKTSGGRSGEKSSGSTNAEDQAENSNDHGDSNAPTPGSLSPSEAGTVGENETADEPSAAPTGKTSKKAGKHSKSKKKRSKKSTTSSVDAPASSTRSSTTKTRSKKGGPLGRPLGSSKNVVNSDPLMQKLKGILEPQKDDFFVVDLYPKCHKCSVPIAKVGYWELKTLPPSNSVAELLEAVKKTRASSSSSRNSPPRHYHHYYCSTCYNATKTQLLHRVELASNGAKRAEELSARILPMNEKAAASELADLDLQEIKYTVSLGFVDPNEDKTKVKTEEGEKEKTSSDAKDDGGDVIMKTEGDSDAARNAATSEPKPAAPAAEAVVKAKDKAVTKARVSDDDLDDVIMPCEIFDTREAFLMYCQNNHCQFDQIRRAKHSSMMVLYHLFNQGTTGFTFSCSGCKIALTSGNRWNCSICPVFNLCDECNAKTKHEHQLHLFKVVPIPKPGEQPETNVPAAGAIGAGKGALLAAQASGATASGPGRPIKREVGSSELKRAKLDKTNSVKNAKMTTGPSRKRKLNQTSSPVNAATGGDAVGAANAASVDSTVAAPSTAFSGDGVSPVAIQAPADGTAPSSAAAAPASASATATSGDVASASATPTSQESGATTSSAADEDPSKKQRRIHNIDPQLLLQLEHASSCTVADCTFFNCHRMRSMLKHGAMCEQRLAGPCVLCKRIVGLLSAHARQCEKDYAVCKVPRCADIRRHFMQQMQQRQEQMERLKQQQQQQQPTAATQPAQPAQPDQKVVTAAAEPVAANPEDPKDVAS
ncbi:Histone acetyltransferase, partial [Globisporangium splendens]